MSRRRRIAASLSIVAVVGLTACAPALPATVVPDTTITAGWTGTLSSTNAAAAPTPGNLDIAAVTRAGFGTVVGGEFVPDEGFGKVSIVGDDPFTVRYDLAEPVWSDGIPLDAADLMLGWAAASGYFADVEDTEDAGDTDAAAKPDVPTVDEFARAIDVTYPQPVADYPQRISAAVPAHVVAGRALGIDDPMEAKQALISAIRDDDADALARIADVWNDGFVLPESDELPADLLVSSGPFQVAAASDDLGGQTVTLVPNAAYRGLVTPQVAKIELVPEGDDPIASIGDVLDVAQVAPIAADRTAIDALERRDLVVDTSHDGTVWALLLNPSGVFAQHPARAAFLRALSSPAMIERGGGVWASAYTRTPSMLSAPGDGAFDVVTEDSGFTAALEGADDSALERDAAGVTAGTPVCVLYDRASEFAAGAYAAARDAALEAGWNAVDCATDDLDGALSQANWDAVIMRVPIPESAAEIADQWGSGDDALLVGAADADRDALIASLAEETDVYAARDLRAQIEASIVRAAVALPIAVNPVVTIIDKDVTGVSARDGAVAPLTSGAVKWAVVP